MRIIRQLFQSQVEGDEHSEHQEEVADKYPVVDSPVAAITELLLHIAFENQSIYLCGRDS